MAHIHQGTPVIYVSFNYRTGPLGFPAGEEATSKKALNLGLKDQRVALEWIHHNIAAFGGDKTKVSASKASMTFDVDTRSPRSHSLGRVLALSPSATNSSGPAWRSSCGQQ